MKFVIRREPETVAKLKAVAEGFTRGMDEASLRKTERHSRRRAELWLSVWRATSNTSSGIVLTLMTELYRMYHRVTVFDGSVYFYSSILYMSEFHKCCFVTSK